MLNSKLFAFLFKSSFFRNLIRYIRCFWYIKFLKKKINILEENENISSNTIFSNKRHIQEDKSNLSKNHKHPSNKYFFGIKSYSNGGKISLLANPLLSINNVFNNKKKMKVLCIGPRDEAEIFNLLSYGFLLKNIFAIDLFSYSPLIKLSDMHDIKFDDNYFDIVFCGWSLIYSNDKQKASNEILRVCKKNAYICTGSTVTTLSNEEIVNKRGYMIGSDDRINNSKDVLKYFEGSLDKIFFDNSFEFENKKINGKLIIIFSISK